MLKKQTKLKQLVCKSAYKKYGLDAKSKPFSLLMKSLISHIQDHYIQQLKCNAN